MSGFVSRMDVMRCSSVLSSLEISDKLAKVIKVSVVH